MDDNSLQDLVMSLPEHSTCLQAELPCGKRDQGQAMIDGLPDEVLLDIFHHCSLPDSTGFSRFMDVRYWSRDWKMLIQVCRRWRYIVLGSPRRLRLRVLCTPATPSSSLLDIWPPLPISILYGNLRVDQRNIKNLTAAFEHRDLASEIYIENINAPALKRFIGAMQQPLPVLTYFCLGTSHESVPVLPETFLGGSAPSLEMFILRSIPFPTFPKFILSATNLAYLTLVDIPNSGYISPDAMATCLASLPSLKRLDLGFQSPLTRPLPVGLPPRTRPILPALLSLFFQGNSEYVEDLLARTHFPLLELLEIQFFVNPILDIPWTHNLINEAECFKLLGHAWVMFDWNSLAIELGLPPRIQLEILGGDQDWQLELLAHICHHYLSLSSVEQLTICVVRRQNISWHRKDDMDISQWLELLHPFIAVRDLYVGREFVSFVTAALQGLTGERAMEVLPVLNNLFLEESGPLRPAREAIKPFVSARQLFNHPIVVHSGPPPQAPWFDSEDV